MMLQIPEIGLGTYDLKEKEISDGLEAGYRLLDTAWQYGNESEVGNAIKNSTIKREDIIITTKLWTEDIRKKRVREEFEESLRNLQTDYVDLYLIHWPAAGFEYAWEVMAGLKEEGKVKEIGVSNFHEHHIQALQNISGIVPILNQIECHPFFQNRQLVEYCGSKGISIQAWCPLGGPYSNMKNHSVFLELSEKYEKTPTQIILRWHIQKQILIIPRTSSRKHLVQNMDIFNFSLCDEDMEKINRLDTGRRIGADPDNFNF